MNNIKSLLEMHNHHQSQMSSSSHFDQASSDDDFLEQMLSSVPNSATSFPWGGEDHATPQPQVDVLGFLEEQSAMLTSKALMLQQQLLLSRGIAAGNGFIGDQNEVVGGSSNASNDASVTALFNGSFNGVVGQTSNQPQHFDNNQGGALEAQNFGLPTGASAPTSEGAAAGQPRQRVRARRGQATDPHSIAERLRRERIAERMKGLQELVPNANKTDKASMLDEIIDYVTFLQLQVKVLSISRLGGAAAVAPIVADIPSEGKSLNGRQPSSSSSNHNDGATVTEQHVAKLLEDDMGSAMQYLQGKGLCLMPISLATAFSNATCHTKSMGTSNLNSPTMSVSTVQSVAMNGGGEVS